MFAVVTDGCGMRKLSSEGERFTDPLERLVRVTEEPEGKCLVAKANYARILPEGVHQTAVLAAIIDPGALLDMLETLDKLSDDQQRDTYSVMSS